MPFIEVCDTIPAEKITKRLGKPNLFGWIRFGWSEFGENSPYNGFYQQRRNRQWNGIDGFIISQTQRNFCMKPYWPVQPPSEARDAQQAKFITALGMWQALTAEQKKDYNTIAIRKSRRGYDYFMSKTLKSL